MDVRRAVAGDAEALSHVAFSAKRHWGYPELSIQHWSDGLTVTPDFVLNNEVYAAVSDSEPFAFYALTGEGLRLEIEHLWVSPERIGLGVCFSSTPSGGQPRSVPKS